jgi:hypothetical protein
VLKALNGEAGVLSAYPVLVDGRGRKTTVIGHELTVRFTGELDEAACEEAESEQESLSISRLCNPL